MQVQFYYPGTSDRGEGAGGRGPQHGRQKKAGKMAALLLVGDLGSSDRKIVEQAGQKLGAGTRTDGSLFGDNKPDSGWKGLEI